MEQKINSLQVCMQKLETTLDFLKSNQEKYTQDNKEAHNEIIDKLDAWIDNSDKNFAKKWVEDELINIKNKNEQRNYDWLKYFIATIVSVAIALFLKP